MSAIERPYAGLVSRTVAVAIDAVTLTIGFAIASGVLGLILSLFTPSRSARPAPCSGPPRCGASDERLLRALLDAHRETPGMRLMALRVINRDGGPLGFGQALLRLIGAILAAIPFFAGYLLILVDDRRRGLHDMIAGTTVIYAPRTPVAGSVPRPRVSPAG